MVLDRELSRRTLLRLAAAGAGSIAVGALLAEAGYAQGLPKLAKKDKYKIGFAQTDNANPWRIAETKSMQDEAKKRGYELIYTDANQDTAKQIADLDNIIAQKPDILIFPPRVSTPLAPSVLKAKQQGIPVILIDRDVDHNIAKPGQDYVTFIGSDFIEQGKRIAEWLVKETGGKAKIIELEGTKGADPATERKQGFDDFILKGEFKGQKVGDPQPDMVILASQDGNFVRDTGRQVMQTLLTAHPDVTAVYAHNDEMAIGAIAALKDGGKKPGTDVIVCSIDGENAAMDAIVAGELGASCESSPFFGPISFDTMLKYANGEEIGPWVKVEDKFFDKSNAKDFVGKQF